MKTVKATARVRVTLDIPVADGWGPSCEVAQVHRQAVEAALDILRRVLVVDGVTMAKDPRARVSIVGVPETIAVLVEEER